MALSWVINENTCTKQRETWKLKESTIIDTLQNSNKLFFSVLRKIQKVHLLLQAKVRDECKNKML